MAEELLKASRRPATRFPQRLNWLSHSLLGVPAFTDPEQLTVSEEIAGLPYQLFSAIGGTLLEAEHRKSGMAILVVHEFRTFATTNLRMDANARALDAFLKLLFARNSAEADAVGWRAGELVGPVAIAERTVPGPCSLPFCSRILTLFCSGSPRPSRTYGKLKGSPDGWSVSDMPHPVST